MERAERDILHDTYEGWDYPTITPEQLRKWSLKIEIALIELFELRYVKAIFCYTGTVEEEGLTEKLEDLTLIVHITQAGEKFITGLDLISAVSSQAF